MTNPSHALNARKQPRQSRSVSTVDAILEAAARILEGGGLNALNTNAVAELAGVSVGSLYQYFPGKDALLAALIRRKRAEMMAAIDAERARAPGRELRTVLHGFIRAAVAHQLARPALARSLEYAEAQLPIDAETEALKHQIIAAVTEVLRAHAVPGAPTVARDLVALTRGMVDAAGLLGETQPRSLERRVRRAVLGYLGMPASTGRVRARSRAARGQDGPAAG